MSFHAPDGSNCTFLMKNHCPILSPPNEKKTPNSSTFLHPCGIFPIYFRELHIDTHCCLCRSSGLLCSTCVKNSCSASAGSFFFFLSPTQVCCNDEAQVITAPSSVYHMRLTRQVCGRMRLLRQIAIFTGCPKRQKVIRAAVIVQFRMLFDFLVADTHKAGSPNVLPYTLCWYAWCLWQRSHNLCIVVFSKVYTPLGAMFFINFALFTT